MSFKKKMVKRFNEVECRDGAKKMRKLSGGGCLFLVNGRHLIPTFETRSPYPRSGDMT